jgi:hypothetical protein
MELLSHKGDDKMRSVKNTVWDRNKVFDHVWNNVVWNDIGKHKFNYTNAWFQVTENLRDIVRNNVSTIEWIVRHELEVSLR